MNYRLEFNREIAERCGIREAVIVTFLWDLIYRDDEETLYRYGRLWTRISQRSVTVFLPFLTVSMVAGSLRKLIAGDIISTDVFNEDKFDHTRWYAFTEYGRNLMEAGC